MCKSLDITTAHHCTSSKENNKFIQNNDIKTTVMPSSSNSNIDNIVITEDLNLLLQQKFILFFLRAFVIFYDFILLNCRLFVLLKKFGETHFLKYCLFWRTNNNKSTNTTSKISNEQKQIEKIQYTFVPDRVVRVIQRRNSLPSSPLRHFCKLSEKSSFYKLYDIEEESMEEEE